MTARTRHDSRAEHSRGSHRSSASRERMGTRVEGRLTGAERSVERLQADIDGLREDVKAILRRLPAKVE